MIHDLLSRNLAAIFLKQSLTNNKCAAIVKSKKEFKGILWNILVEQYPKLLGKTNG